MFLAISAASSGHAENWVNSRGGPERDGLRQGTADLAGAQVIWKQSLGGRLGPSQWLVSSDSRGAYVAAGGRIRKKRWDDLTHWSSSLIGLETIVAQTDLNGDGTVDAIFATGNQFAPLLAGLTPQGEVAFRISDPELDTIGVVRIVDINGDGKKELYVASLAGGLPGSEARVYEFPNGLASGTLKYKIKLNRDYVASYFDVIGEFDGTPGLEIAAAGRKHLYLYNANNGKLESESPDIGNVPFGRATLRAVDTDDDDIMELIAYSNEAWAPNDNRRHVTVFEWDAQTNSLNTRWTVNVTDLENDRVAFVDESAGDLENDGSIEIVFSLFDAAQNTWTTQVRDAATGAQLDTFAGELEAIAGGYIFVKSETATTALKFRRNSGFTKVKDLPDSANVHVARCRDDKAEQRETETIVPCTLSLNGQTALVLQKRNAIGSAVLSISAVTLNDSLSQLVSYVPQGSTISSIARIKNDAKVSLAVVLTSGLILPLDSNFEPSAPHQEFAYGGIHFGTMFSGFDVPSFPLTFEQSDAGYENVFAINANGNAQVLDASDNPTIAGGATTLWTDSQTSDDAVISQSGALILFDQETGVRGLDGATGDSLWQRSGLLSAKDDIRLHSNPLLVSRNGAEQIWFHRRDSNKGQFDLTVLNPANGQDVLTRPALATNNSGWKRLSLLGSGAEAIPASGPLGQVWTYDAVTGEPSNKIPVASSSMIIALPDAPTQWLIIGSEALELFDSQAKQVLWSVPLDNTRPLRRGALLKVGEQWLYGTSHRGSPEFLIVNTADGEVVKSITLVGGAVDSTSAMESLVGLGNVSAISDSTGTGTPAFLVGSSDGYLYEITGEGDVAWSLFVDAPVGEVVPADWDGDGKLELVVSAADGTLLGVDSFVGAPPAFVNDTDGETETDIDEISTYDTLYAAWSPVEGATSYLVAVYDADGVVVADSEQIISADNHTATFAGLQLIDGARYHIAVRAMLGTGISPDTQSDGVTVFLTDAPDEDDDSDCGCCSLSGKPARLPWFSVLLGASGTWLIFRRRKRVV